jgi:hypothetical protein
MDRGLCISPRGGNPCVHDSMRRFPALEVKNPRKKSKNSATGNGNAQGDSQLGARSGKVERPELPASRARASFSPGAELCGRCRPDRCVMRVLAWVFSRRIRRSGWIGRSLRGVGFQTHQIALGTVNCQGERPAAEPLAVTHFSRTHPYCDTPSIDRVFDTVVEARKLKRFMARLGDPTESVNSFWRSLR